MKTLKTFAIATLIAGVILAPVSAALAGPVVKMKPCHKTVLGCGKSQINPNVFKNAQPNKGANPPAAQPQVHNHYHRDDGAVWGALAGGTMLGLVVGSMANQPEQPAQPQVVYVQQAPDQQTPTDTDLEFEIERERARVRALEEELQRIRAEKE
jgi:hypothetical protein